MCQDKWLSYLSVWTSRGFSLSLFINCGFANTGTASSIYIMDHAAWPIHLSSEITLWTALRHTDGIALKALFPSVCLSMQSKQCMPSMHVELEE